MRTILSIAMLAIASNVKAQTIINKENSQIHVGSNLMGFFPPDMFAEAFATLIHQPSNLQVCLQGGPIIQALAAVPTGLRADLSEIVQTNNTGIRVRLNVNRLISNRYYVGLQYQYKDVNTAFKYWKQFGSMKRISDHEIATIKQSISAETGYYKETVDGQFVQLGFSAGLALRDIKVNEEHVQRSNALMATQPFEGDVILPQLAVILRVGFCVYGRK
jgi:hypothetical protein